MIQAVFAVTLNIGGSIEIGQCPYSNIYCMNLLYSFLANEETTFMLFIYIATAIVSILKDFLHISVSYSRKSSRTKCMAFTKCERHILYLNNSTIRGRSIDDFFIII